MNYLLAMFYSVTSIFAMAFITTASQGNCAVHNDYRLDISVPPMCPFSAISENTIPATVHVIGAEAFQYCTCLTNTHYETKEVPK